MRGNLAQAGGVSNRESARLKLPGEAAYYARMQIICWFFTRATATSLENGLPQGFRPGLETMNHFRLLFRDSAGTRACAWFERNK
jgi:hypothetical protein